MTHFRATDDILESVTLYVLGALPADLVDALHEARLWRMLLPRSYGGDEVSPVDYVQAIEEIAKD